MSISPYAEMKDRLPRHPDGHRPPTVEPAVWTQEEVRRLATDAIAETQDRANLQHRERVQKSF